MGHPPRSRFVRVLTAHAPAALIALVLLACGCTTLDEWVHNGFKVGPNYHEPPAAVAPQWIDDADVGILHGPGDCSAWWAVFKDPTLNAVIDSAYQENLDLKTAAARVLEARAQRNIACGNLFPQTQNAIGDYAHAQISKNFNFFNSPEFAIPNILNVWTVGFNASWELDFWGRLRRQVESANAELDSSAEGYHDALVTLLADVATNYVQLRTFQQRLAYARRNVELQKDILNIVEARFKDGRASGLDVAQIQSNLAQTEATIPPLEIGLRQANDRLCVLLGQPAKNLVPVLHEGTIPAAPPAVAVSIPAELLMRRPDVRRARAEVAAQTAQIGVAEADYYPRIAVTGFIGYASDDIRRLFDESSFTGLILPNFQWKILNYGRILNNVRLQDARGLERVLQYQQTVLKAGQEVEDALIGFLQFQLQARSLEKSVRAAERSVELVKDQVVAGRADYNRVFTTESQLVTQQDQLALARGNIALSLIAVYRALGGGWQFYEKEPSQDSCVTSPPVEKWEGAGPDSPPADAGKPKEEAPTLPSPKPVEPKPLDVSPPDEAK